MDTIQFLDLSGLDDAEVNHINGWLYNTSSEYPLPWIIKHEAPLDNDYGVQNSQCNFNGTSTETYTSTAEPVNYPTQMTFISIPYNPNQLPQMYNSFMQNHYHHPSMYTNYHHSPQLMGSNDQVHYMYSPNQVYNYAQVPVSYENHPQQNEPYCSPPIQDQIPEETHVYNNNVPNGEITNYEEPKITQPPIDIAVNSVPISNSNETKSKAEPIVTKPDIALEEKPVIANVVPKPEILKKEKIEDTIVKENGISPKVNDPVPSVWGKKTWVSLFQKDTPTSNGSVKPESNINADVVSLKKPNIEKLIDPVTYRLGEYIMSYQIDGRQTNLQPRGLVNKSNYCYINSILQALLACPPLCNLLVELSKNLKGGDKVKSIPMIENMCKLMDEFEVLPAISQGPRSNKKNNKKQGNININLNCGNPFEATWFYTMLNGTRSDSFLVEGRQEDAEEFLGLLLNGLNDEMLNIKKSIGKEESTTVIKQEIHQDADDWKVMGPKNKGNITRKVQFDKTPISDIFGGLLCSKIHKTGDESTVNIQPFFTLQLNIEKAETITEALENFTTRIQLEGLTSSKTKQTVEAWQQVMIEQLPVVLVLHLKCFDYKMDGCTKIMKTLDFPIDLKIDSKILSGRTPTEKQYKLFAVVYHEGKEASKGHYIADVFHSGYNCWLRFDDSKIRPVSEENLLRPQGFRVPYLLFYRRSDTIKGV